MTLIKILHFRSMLLYVFYYLHAWILINFLQIIDKY